MALEATHIRFALDLKDRLNISNTDKYISGTVYPDSRYNTRINRDSTHSKNVIETFLKSKDDFKKGWAIHLMCDTIQSDLLELYFSEIIEKDKIEQGNDIWVSKTALKILQDVEDVKHYDIHEYLPCLEYVHNPNNENIEIIKEYNQTIKQTYQKKDVTSYTARYDMWLKLGIGTELTEKVRERTETFVKNNDFITKTQKLYDQMFAIANKQLDEIELSNNKQSL